VKLNRRRPAAGRTRTKGQALVEFALVIPLFILILAGILDFGFMLYTRMTIISSAREGARIAVTSEDKTTIPAKVTSAVQAASTGLVVGSLTITPTCIRTSGTCVFAGSGATLAKAGDSVKVTVSYPYRSFFPLLFGAQFNLSTSVQMVLE
jgi:Flp pilus assembly protein TadG